ncbi:GNAT family N-acetyltransferase [Jannaschia sp. CCS1]|uniref:GNAT family N-acetyltransferase n=1 Tax=Jannaschia sp. (strain CCS1) TaxID=290400 RepID=UPI000053BBEB|nr:GNAT family N-acetyltransferase [Jannaschia sp. CCS1]ABD53779.1 GCN5-related N-acetyltransferase [Jannaschia sp. CCS1]
MTPARMAALHGACFARGWPEAEMAELLAKPTTLAATTDHGFALLQLIAPEAEVLTIIVDPALRGQGHGRALLGQALLAAQKGGAETVFLEVDAENAPARALYTRAGFIQTGTRKGYYTHKTGRHSDAIVMARALEPGI